MSFPKLKTIKRLIGSVGIAMLAVGGVGLVPASANVEIPIPTADVSYVQPSCSVDHAVVTVTDTTPLSDLVSFYFEKVTSPRGLEGQPADSIDRGTSVSINTMPIAYGQTVVLTVQSEADATEGNIRWYDVASGYSVHRPTAAECGMSESVTAVMPVVTDQVITCTKDFTLKTTGASITIPVTEGVEYLLDGKVVTGVLPVVPGTYSYSARAKDGSVLSAPLNVFLGVNAGVAPVCKKPVVVVVTPPTTPKVTPHKVTPVALPRVSTPVKTTASATNPKIVTDYVSDASTGLGWWLSLVIGGLGLWLVSRVFPRRKVQENKH